jgi:transcriptional regulator with GAF, ATPase, and Fis domain
LIGDSPGLVAVRKQVGMTRRLLPVLILGETGAAGQFVAVNCAAIPGTLLEADLFGF